MRLRALLLCTLLAGCETRAEDPPAPPPSLDTTNRRGAEIEAEIDAIGREVDALNQKVLATNASLPTLEGEARAAAQATLATYQQQLDALLRRYDDVQQRVAALRGSAAP